MAKRRYGDSKMLSDSFGKPLTEKVVAKDPERTKAKRALLRRSK